MNNAIQSEILVLRNRPIAYIASINEDGYPQMKAMQVLEHDSMKTHYFSTNTSSKRVQQFLKNPKASVYYCQEVSSYKGALFTGVMEVCTDHDTKAFLWRDGFERYYPKGVDDEDYCVYKFTAETVNYYHGLKNTTLAIEELSS
ncbi:MAG: pyridoxamine 5'-phosphate oxidase family protein [Oscillospiraceae bacterium]|nr:pyridoxamine 5'-phosphate oxidase family protein [Oscillospiraceae bacterium]